MTAKKIILDTNALLRFITGDDMVKCSKVSELLDKTDCTAPIEVIAEAVYNLDKYYKHPRQIIAAEIKDFISIKEDFIDDEIVVRYGCNVFASTNLDFVDCILVAYANVKDNEIFSFDDPLNKKLGHKAFNRN